MATPTRPRARRLLGLVLAATTALFTTTTATANAQRGYELVTPPDDGAYDITVPWTGNDRPLGAGSGRRSTADGEHVVFLLANGGVNVGETLPGVAPDGEVNDFGIASRGEAGWDWDVPLGEWSSVNGCSFEGGQLEFDTISEDARTMLLRVKCQSDKTVFSGGLDQTVWPTPTLYATDVETDSVSFVGAKLGPDGPIARPGPGSVNDQDYFVGGSSDLSTVYFATRAGLLPDLPDVGPSFGYLYRWSAGVTTLVTKTMVGVPFSMRTDPTGHLEPDGLERPNVVSRDGNAVTLTAPPNRAMVAADSNSISDVYQVRDGEPIWVSQPTRSPAATPAPRYFLGASADGARVVFTTTEPMTDDDQDSRKDLFVADLQADQLTRVSTGALNDNGDATTDDAYFVTMSDDGSHVYFITGSQLDNEDGDGGGSLYVHDLDSATTLYVGPTTSPVDGDEATSRSLADEQTAFSGKWIKVTPDGQVAFVSLATDVSLPAGRGGPDSDGARDLFVWRERDGLRRVRQGFDADANTDSVPGLGCFGQESIVGWPVPCRALTFDGSLVFFETTDALVPADTNGELQDVYAMHTDDGSIELISPPSELLVQGTGDDASAQYVDSSASGHHVFFLTRETLDPERDLDRGRVDIYSARLGEVFGPPPPQPPCTPGVDCAAASQPAPARPSLMSAPLGGPENLFSPRRVTMSVRRPGRRVLRRAVRSGVLPLTVRVSAPGRIVAVARTRVGGELRTVATARKRLRTPGSGKLMLPLSESLRRQLSRGKAVRVTIRVRATGVRARSMTLTLEANR